MSSVASTRWRRDRLLILCYHWLSFRDEHETDPAGYVTPAFFRRRLQRLRDRKCSVLPLGEALDRLAQGTLPPRSVAITFDDGTRDFAELAVPILREFSMPATVYITTYYCERLVPVFDIALRYLLSRVRDRDAVLAAIGAATQPSASRDAAWQAISDFARRGELSGTEKNDLLRRIAESGGMDYAAFLAIGICQQMTPEQIRDLPRDLIDVGLHTHRHRTPRNRESFVREIRENRTCLDSYMGGRKLEHFCYPSGDYWGEFFEWLRDEGVTSATTCVPNLASPSDSRFLLPRFLDSSGISDDLFDAWISGFAAFLPRRREHRFDAWRLETRAG